MQWEYYIVELDMFDRIAELEELLDKVGCLGWELVTVKKTVYIFKRPRTEDKE